MSKIDNIANDSFMMPVRDSGPPGLALLSLKIALKAYFTTYKSMKYSLHLFDNNNNIDQATIDANHNTYYCELCSETIVHFQHFIELICKDYLRAEHPLLAVDASTRPVILDKLLKNERVAPDDYENLKSLEFSTAFKRLCILIEENRLGSAQLNFILHAKESISKLNYLRNRLWHRGIYILRYPALDIFISKYLLPFVIEVVKMPAYASSQAIWKYKGLACKVDPIEAIMDAGRQKEFDLGRIAFLKELGRAAYENPLRLGKWESVFDKEYMRRAELSAAAEEGRSNISHILKCPVCGLKSLVVYDDVETEGEDFEKGTYVKAWRYTWQVKCTCCTFGINYRLKNPSEYNLPIDDYWHAEEL